MFKKLFSFFFLLLPFFGKSTCIVIFVVGNAIYIAADSKSVLSHYDLATGKSQWKSDTSICKIHFANSYYYSVYGIKDQTLTKSAGDALRSNQPLSERLKKFEKEMTAYYNKDTMYIKENYGYTPKMDNDIGGCVFFSFTGQTPRIDYVFFVLKKNNKGAFYVESNNIFSQGPLMYLGRRDHIDKLTPQQLDAIVLQTQKKPEGFVKHLVELELSYHPSEIGKPIDVVSLTAAGRKWFSPERKCD